MNKCLYRICIWKFRSEVNQNSFFDFFEATHMHGDWCLSTCCNDAHLPHWICNGTCLLTDSAHLQAKEICFSYRHLTCSCMVTLTWLCFVSFVSTLVENDSSHSVRSFSTSPFVVCAIQRPIGRSFWSVWQQHIACISWNQEKGLPLLVHSHQRFWLHN